MKFHGLRNMKVSLFEKYEVSCFEKYEAEKCHREANIDGQWAAQWQMQANWETKELFLLVETTNRDGTHGQHGNISFTKQC